jgi:hypothetical protein
MNRLNLYADNYPNFETQFITQGSVGNCWLISVLISLSLTEKGKKLLSNIFFVNQDGTYTIKLFDNVRKANYITFEPLFTVERDENNNLQMLFSGANLNIPEMFLNNPNTEFIWPCIIEKAVSKYLGSIRRQDGNVCATAFNLLTNNDVNYCLNMVMNKRFISKFKDLMKDNKICATLETRKSLPNKYSFLLTNHAYSIYKLDGENLHIINPHEQFTDESKTNIVNIRELREFTDSITYIYL